MNKTFFLLLIIVLFTFSCNSNQDKKDDATKEESISEPEIIKMPADTVFVKSPPKIVQSPRVVGSRILFTNCRNTIHFDAPEGFSDLKIMADGVKLSIFKNQSQPDNYWDIIPKTTGTHTLNCSATLDDIQYNWSETLEVINPPKPSVEFFVNGKKSDGRIPIPKTSRITIELIPDPNFKEIMPKEANYYVTTIDVLAQLSLGPPTKVNSTSGHDKSIINVALGTRVRQLRPGSTVMLKINEIYRKNDMKQRIPDRRFTEVERIISFTVR